MIETRYRAGGHRGPGPSGRVPQLCCKHRRCCVVKPGSARATSCQHFSIRQHGRVHHPSGHAHRADRAPCRHSGIQVNDFSRVGRRIGAADCQYLARFVHHGAAVITLGIECSVRDCCPCTCTRSIEIAGRHLWPRIENRSVRGQKHVRVQWKRKLGR